MQYFQSKCQLVSKLVKQRNSRTVLKEKGINLPELVCGAQIVNLVGGMESEVRSPMISDFTPTTTMLLCYVENMLYKYVAYSMQQRGPFAGNSPRVGSHSSFAEL